MFGIIAFSAACVLGVTSYPLVRQPNVQIQMSRVADKLPEEDSAGFRLPPFIHPYSKQIYRNVSIIMDNFEENYTAIWTFLDIGKRFFYCF